MRQCISTRSAGDTKLGGIADTCKDIQRELVRPEKQPVRNILQFNTHGGPSRYQAKQEPAVHSGNDGSQWAALHKSRKVIITPYLAFFRHICNAASSFRVPTLKKSVNELSELSGKPLLWTGMRALDLGGETEGMGLESLQRRFCWN